MKKSRLWGPAPLGEGTVGLAPINPPLILVCYSAGFDTTSSDAEFYSFYLQDVMHRTGHKQIERQTERYAEKHNPLKPSCQGCARQINTYYKLSEMNTFSLECFFRSLDWLARRSIGWMVLSCMLM